MPITVLARITDDAHEAEDVTREVLIQAWTALSGFLGESRFTTCLYRIVVNRSLTHVRRRRLTVELSEEKGTPGVVIYPLCGEGQTHDRCHCWFG